MSMLQTVSLGVLLGVLIGVPPFMNSLTLNKLTKVTERFAEVSALSVSKVGEILADHEKRLKELEAK